jgi:hypothetical protein
MITKTTWMFIVALAGLLAPAVSSARDFGPQGYAARTGLSFNPDQFQAGVHLQLGTSSKPQLRPAMELGIGNGVRLVSLSGDVLYHFGRKQWSPYAGGGPGLNFIDVTDGVGEADGLETKLVAHAVTGVTWAPRRGRHRYFLEGRIGVGDTPNLRISLGMSF